jgi:hypothetical protein
MAAMADMMHDMAALFRHLQLESVKDVFEHPLVSARLIAAAASNIQSLSAEQERRLAHSLERFARADSVVAGTGVDLVQDASGVARMLESVVRDVPESQRGELNAALYDVLFAARSEWRVPDAGEDSASARSVAMASALHQFYGVEPRGPNGDALRVVIEDWLQAGTDVVDSLRSEFGSELDAVLNTPDSLDRTSNTRSALIRLRLRTEMSRVQVEMEARLKEIRGTDWREPPKRPTRRARFVVWR